MKPKANDEIVRSTMVKKVNVIAQIPIRNVYPPIYGTYKGISMSPANILKCLMHKAIVEEVLADGSTVKLTTKNYNTVNTPVEVKEPKLENRRSGVLNQRNDTRNLTMKQLETHTAPLPESHYLYHIKEECNSEAPMDSAESEQLDKDYVEKQVQEATDGVSRDMPTVDTETGETKGESL